MMKKIIHKIGDSTGIIFNREERKIYNLQKDKIVEVIIKIIE